MFIPKCTWYTTLSQFRNFINCEIVIYDLIILIETWWHIGITDKELGLHDYVVYCCDRNPNTSDPEFDGVLIDIRKPFCRRVMTAKTNTVEHGVPRYCP